ncbi:unnamed protein product, partial [marine sediment metagenome]
GKCIKDCTLCSQVCPGKDVPILEIPKQFDENEPFQKGWGYYRDIFLGRIKDEGIKKESTSGGAVTAILLAALKKKIIDGAIIVGSDPKAPYKSIAMIATTEEDIIGGVQSKYVVTPVNQMLKELDKSKSYAIVALPCQIIGLKKIAILNPDLVRNIRFTIGLFCHSTMYFKGTKDLIQRSGVKRFDEIKKIRYRQGDFPGGFVVETETGLTKRIALSEYMPLFGRYMLNRCRLCIHHFNVLCDIAVADPFPFLDELKAQDKKWTV